jgi:argininosuccinate lyase
MSSPRGRFRKPLDPAALKFSSSLAVDKRLFEEDIKGSIAHLAMLSRQGIIPRSEARRMRAALQTIAKEIRTGVFIPGDTDGGRFSQEDIHMAIEARLTGKVGPIGGKLHTARSRNDQVALDERLYLRTTTGVIRSAIRKLQSALLQKAEQYVDTIIPGYTHLQRAQPVLLAHHLLAYISMLDRDRARFADCLGRVNLSPLGAAALAGTPFPINRRAVARALGFDGLLENSIDAVSDRDVQIEFAGCCAVTMMHLSRMCEELVLWSSQEWNFAMLGEEVTTGSSIMPQKKNPDIAELVRGKTGRVYGSLMGLLTVMKGLPLAYNRDMQEDKPLLFDAADTTSDSLQMCALMFSSIAFNTERFAKELDGDFLLATELADYLVRKRMPFREAHGVVGAIVHDCIAGGTSLGDLTGADLLRYSPAFGRDARRLLRARASIEGKRSAGSTAPVEVRKALRRWKKTLGTKR